MEAGTDSPTKRPPETLPLDATMYNLSKGLIVERKGQIGMSLPAQIKSARLRLGLTQAEAAAVCEVSPRAYWQWEAGKSTLGVTLDGALERLRTSKKRPKAKGQNDLRQPSLPADGVTSTKSVAG